MRNLVIIPTYNNIDNIGEIIKTISVLSLSFEIMIIDDYSPDGTASIVKNLQAQNQNLHLIERNSKMDLGTANITGFIWALKNNYDYIFEMDADLAHDPLDLIKLYNACNDEGADVAIGSRYIKGVTVVNWPISRVIMSYLASIYVRIITGMKIIDTTAGLICYKREVLENIRPDKIRSKGYAFKIEMKFIAYKFGYKIVEIPVIFTDKKPGSSKMSGGLFYEAFWGVIRMKIRSIFIRYVRE